MIFAHVFENDWLGILPEGFLAVTILGLLVAGVILSTSAPMGFPLMVVPMIYLSVWALLVTVLLVLHTPFEMVAFTTSLWSMPWRGFSSSVSLVEPQLPY
jgi:hypothetical protein